ncbi:MAG: aspartate kinase [Pseudomonadota bacterium]
MALYVHKYGGTSVGSVERIEHVAKLVAADVSAGHQVVVVVSAMSGETNRLVALAEDVSDSVSSREMDVLLSTGEQVTIALLSMVLNRNGVPARSYTGWQIRMLTDESHTKARIQHIEQAAIRRDLDAGRVVVVAGFQGVTEGGDISTLGRGGSDTSAVAIAAALEADECRIYTDVDGVYTTDPRVEPRARRLEKITFEEMLELASLGSKVLQIRAVEFAGKYNVPLRVLSSFEPDDGTLITYDEEDSMEDVLVSGIAFNRDEAQLTLAGVPDQPGVAARILGPVSDANIEVDMIVQNAGIADTTDFTFTVHRSAFKQTQSILQQCAVDLNAGAVNVNEEIVKVSIVGVGMRSHAGVASTMFSALAAEGINILMISTSEIKISVVIDERYLELAVRTLHTAFDLDEKGGN